MVAICGEPDTMLFGICLTNEGNDTNSEKESGTSLDLAHDEWYGSLKKKRPAKSTDK